MAIVNFYLDTRREKKDGVYPLKINIRHKGKFLLSTGFSVAVDKWAGSEFSNKVENYKTKNAALRKLLNDMENTIFRLEMDGKLQGMTDKSLKAIL